MQILSAAITTPKSLMGVVSDSATVAVDPVSIPEALIPVLKAKFKAHEANMVILSLLANPESKPKEIVKFAKDRLMADAEYSLKKEQLSPADNTQLTHLLSNIRGRYGLDHNAAMGLLKKHRFPKRDEIGFQHGLLDRLKESELFNALTQEEQQIIHACCWKCSDNVDEAISQYLQTVAKMAASSTGDKDVMWETVKSTLKELGTKMQWSEVRLINCSDSAQYEFDSNVKQAIKLQQKKVKVEKQLPIKEEYQPHDELIKVAEGYGKAAELSFAKKENQRRNIDNESPLKS